jgi:hypothetical protein
LQYSSTILLGKQLIVSFTANYQGASVGYYFLAAVWNVKTNSFASGSTFSSNPVPCLQATGSYAWAAVCAYALSNLQGSEAVTFALSVDSVGTYQFSALAFIVDSNFNVVANNPLTQNEFSVSIIDKFTLTVDVPDKVSVTLDGVQEAAGPTSLQLSPGTHVISAPDIVQIDSTSRLKFKGWSDGSMQTTRTFDLESDTQIGATYATQYFVSTTSDSTLESGWYDQGTVLQFTVNDTQLANKYRLLVGGFDGWYNSGRLITKSPSASLTVSGPVNLNDKWNYLPYLPPVLIVAAVAVILFLGRRGTIATPRLPMLKMPGRARKRARRRRSKVKTFTPTTERQAAAQTTEIKEAETTSARPKTTMYCNQCGAVVSRDSKFCKECGAKQN